MHRLPQRAGNAASSLPTHSLSQGYSELHSVRASARGNTSVLNPLIAWCHSNPRPGGPPLLLARRGQAAGAAVGCSSAAEAVGTVMQRGIRAVSCTGAMHTPLPAGRTSAAVHSSAVMRHSGRRLPAGRRRQGRLSRAVACRGHSQHTVQQSSIRAPAYGEHQQPAGASPARKNHFGKPSLVQRAQQAAGVASAALPSRPSFQRQYLFAYASHAGLQAAEARAWRKRARSRALGAGQGGHACKSGTWMACRLQGSCSHTWGAPGSTPLQGNGKGGSSQHAQPALRRPSAGGRAGMQTQGGGATACSPVPHTELASCRLIVSLLRHTVGHALSSGKAFTAPLGWQQSTRGCRSRRSTAHQAAAGSPTAQAPLVRALVPARKLLLVALGAAAVGVRRLERRNSAGIPCTLRAQAGGAECVERGSVWRSVVAAAAWAGATTLHRLSSLHPHLFVRRRRRAQRWWRGGRRRRRWWRRRRPRRRARRVARTQHFKGRRVERCPAGVVVKIEVAEQLAGRPAVQKSHPGAVVCWGEHQALRVRGSIRVAVGARPTGAPHEMGWPRAGAVVGWG